MDDPTPRQVSRDVANLRADFKDELKSIKDDVQYIRHNMIVPSTFHADQKRQDKSIETVAEDVKDIQKESKDNRKMVIANFLFPLLILAIAYLINLGAGGAAGP